MRHHIKTMRGCLWVFRLFDVSEAIRTDELQRLRANQEARGHSATRQSVQSRIWFEPPPMVQTIGDVTLLGERFRAELHYYSYGVVCLRLELSFDLDWPALVDLSARWMAAPELETAATELVARALASTGEALIKPYHPQLTEDYLIIRLDPLTTNDSVLSAADLLASSGDKIAQLVRGETNTLAPEEQAHILAARLSYYPTDLVVAGWTAAFVYDTPSGAEPTLELIEYANTQLLEFRFYDELLTRTLQDVYRLLDEGTGFWRRWRLANEAERLNTIRLDVLELSERAENAAKFLSDMFAARLYRLVAEKVGVPDYRRLVVDEKLRTAAELYGFMTARVHQSSALILEATVVIILIIDLVLLFRGKG